MRTVLAVLLFYCLTLMAGEKVTRDDLVRLIARNDKNVESVSGYLPYSLGLDEEKYFRELLHYASDFKRSQREFLLILDLCGQCPSVTGEVGTIIAPYTTEIAHHNYLDFLKLNILRADLEKIDRHRLREFLIKRCEDFITDSERFKILLVELDPCKPPPPRVVIVPLSPPPPAATAPAATAETSATGSGTEAAPSTDSSGGTAGY
ncbi:MAG: hypothetical protein PHW04_13950 [Candidatus Wallbacteria bacterium]|nr:hypothetical protein [Candidatus Wallbacteria bacterium]